MPRPSTGSTGGLIGRLGHLCCMVRRVVARRISFASGAIGQSRSRSTAQIWTRRPWRASSRTGRHRIAVDDADSASEQPLLHLHNSCLESRGSLLIAARQPPGSWKVTLRDLGSRLRAALAIAIDPPDDRFLARSSSSTSPTANCASLRSWFLICCGRWSGLFAAAADITARLDQASLRDGRAITVPLARKLLTERGP